MAQARDDRRDRARRLEMMRGWTTRLTSSWTYYVIGIPGMTGPASSGVATTRSIKMTIVIGCPPSMTRMLKGVMTVE